MDAQTVSALAAWAAAGVAAIGASFQFFIGRRQSQAALTSANAALTNAKNAGRHTIAEFRQEWIDKVIDALCEHHAIILTSAAGDAVPADDQRKLASLRTKLELLLNPNEEDTVALLTAIDLVVHAETAQDRAAATNDVVRVARQLLKREWVRLKDELQ